MKTTWQLKITAVALVVTLGAVTACSDDSEPTDQAASTTATSPETTFSVAATTTTEPPTLPVDEQRQPQATYVTGPVQWDYRPAVTPVPEFSLTDEKMIIFNDVFYAATAEGLSRSDDGIKWQTLDESNTAYEGDIAPSWLSDPEAGGREPRTFATDGESLLVLDVPRSERSQPPAPVHLWRSDDAETWSLTRVKSADTQTVAGITWSEPTAAIAASPGTVLVASETVAEIDWWSFDPGTFQPDAFDPDTFYPGIFDPTDITFDPGPAGITINNDIAGFLGAEGWPNFIPWDEMDPAARAAYDWWLQHENRVELHAIDTAGNIAAVEWPLGDRSLGGLDWTGNEFIAWSAPSNGYEKIVSSLDGHSWGEPIRASYDISGTIGNVVIASGYNGTEISTDLGETFESIDLDLTDFVIDVRGEPTWRNPEWDLPAGQQKFTKAALRDAVGPSAQLEMHKVYWVPTMVRNNLAIKVLITAGTRDVMILSSTDGREWTKTIVPRSLATTDTGDDIATSGLFAFVAPDGTTYLYDSSGVHIGRRLTE